MITRERRAVPRRYLMCPPEHFAVTYAINPWMKDEDAEVLGLNAVSDGRHVVLPVQAVTLAGQLFQRGFVPVGVDMSELLKGGGGAKCCTLELRS
ncbi:MAG TPA: hypothetical protein VFV73_43490 [Streptosporangiaceae bacterium]|nr:hypothetical protein [Streptosporangiaceae bacterium]